MTTIDNDPATREGEAAERTAVQQSALRAIAAEPSPLKVVFGWMAATDLSAITIHFAAGGILKPLLASGFASAAVSAGLLWRTREAALKARIKTARSRRKVQAHAKTAILLGSLWEMTAATWTPFGPHGGVQIALIGGGLAMAVPYVRRNSRTPAAAPVAEIAVPREDARLSGFREQFCQAGPLQDALLHGLRGIQGGFQFGVTPQLARRGNYGHVKQLEPEIAALYGVPLDQVSVELPENRSYRSAVVTVLTETRAHERDEPWDGVSTYDPATGCVDLGRFPDGSRSHYQLHIPGSGATCGIAGGSQGSGKTGTLHVIASEAGQAKMCVACGAEASCPRCQMQRICGLWMGDPQRKPFGVWRGRADLTAWGPLSCVRMLWWLDVAMEAFAIASETMDWTDHLGRTHYGKGWFDPEPGMPMIQCVITEWPKLAKDPEYGPIAIELAERIGDERRKFGAGLIVDTQGGDVRVLGQRNLRTALTQYNAIAHQGDRYLGQMLRVEGNPENLPQGVHGVSFLRGVDGRSDVPQRTKHLRENLRRGETGVDVREIADRIAADPIIYHPAFQQAIEKLGYTGPGQVLADEDGWDLAEIYGDTTKEETPAEPASAPQPATEATALKTPVADLMAVHDALTHRSGSNVHIHDVMTVTGLSALKAERALDALIDAGRAVQKNSGEYALR